MMTDLFTYNSKKINLKHQFTIKISRQIKYINIGIVLNQNCVKRKHKSIVQYFNALDFITIE